MAAVSPQKVLVRLTDEQRRALARLVRTGTRPAAVLRRAQVLLKADAGGPDAWSDTRIGEALGCSFMTVRRVRQQFAAGEAVRMALHAEARVVAERSRVRAERPGPPVLGPPHPGPRRAGAGGRGVGAPPQRRGREGRVAVHGRGRAGEDEEAIPYDPAAMNH
jgi:hypothetical protein